MNSWLADIKRKYLHGWDRRQTCVLIGTAVLLTLHKHISRRSFYRANFSEYFHFIGDPLVKILPYHYWFLMSGFTLLLFPMLVVKFGIKDHLRDYGFRLGNGKLGWGFVLVGWLLMVPVIILAVELFPSFQQKYPLSKVAGDSWQMFIPYEISYGIYMFSWEYFFRGFMLFGLEKRFGKYSILIQTIPFAVLHYSKPFPEAMGSIPAGILLGVLALETRSFIYGAAIHWFVALSMDIVAVLGH